MVLLLMLARKKRLFAVLGCPVVNHVAYGPPLPAAATAIAPETNANTNTSASIVGYTCELCANNAILVATTPLYLALVWGGGADDVGVTTTTVAGKAAAEDIVP